MAVQSNPFIQLGRNCLEEVSAGRERLVLGRRNRSVISQLQQVILRQVFRYLAFYRPAAQARASRVKVVGCGPARAAVKIGNKFFCREAMKLQIDFFDAPVTQE